MGQLFNETGKLISERKGITGVNTIISKIVRGCRQAHCAVRLIRSPTPKAYLVSDSVLCVGKMGNDPIATWMSKVKWYVENHHFKEMKRIDGMPTEFEWKIFTRITTLGLLEEIQKLMKGIQCEPEHFKDRIIFMSMYNDIEWGAKGNEAQCEYNSQTVAEYARRCPRGHWSFLGPGSEEKWNGTYTDKPDGSWNQSAENMMANFSGSGHPIFRASSAFARGELRSKEGSKKSTHFNGRHENIELLLCTVISANQLSVYGAIAELCNEVSKNVRAPGKPAARDHLEKIQKFRPTSLSLLQKILPMHSSGGNLWQEHERKFEQLSKDQKLSKLCSDAGFESCRTGQYFYTLDTEEGLQMQHLCREYTIPRNEKGTRIRGWILKNTRICPVLNIKVCYHDDRYNIEVQIPSLFQDNTASWVGIVNGVDKCM